MTTISKEQGNRSLVFDKNRLEDFIKRVTSINSKEFNEKIIRSIEAKDEYKAEHITSLLIKTALENVDEASTQWTFDAAKIYLQSLYKKASVNRSYDKELKYGDFYGLLKSLAGKGIYSPNILKKYSREEIKELSKLIDPDLDLLFDYIGLHTLATRYLATDHDKNTYELPQERWLVIAMHLMQDEPAEQRSHLVAESYWALSNLYMTVATPTLANAGLAHGQLSSCFIDTVDDSLMGIYNSNTDVARLSKDGGGIGVYMGKVRSRGSSIKGFKGASSGCIPWIKQLNNTAVSVDQLGRRKGAIAVYLDVWHADILSFLDLKLNNGDERQRAHDIFTGVCLPDVFMEQVERRGDWYLFDPHEVKNVMGYALEDFYDEKKGQGSFREKYEECVQNNHLNKTKIPAIKIMARIMKSQLETGTPFMFYRDEVNRKNPNKHVGIIYSSNLCTEIMQNMSPTIQYEETVEGDTIISYKKAGDFVVCNLSSINLGKAVPEDALERLIPIQIRMLDNVIDLNTIDVKQATITNKKYRAIGLGTFGWHHLLALKKIKWESQDAVKFADKLYERISFLTIKASLELAKEKGSYSKFAGSDWQTGDYFIQRGYLEGENADNWKALMKEVAEHGMRNGYLMAVAPNSSTSVIAGSTASIDPIFKTFYHEEKKDYKLPVVAPDLDHNTYDIYRRSAYIVDQRWSILQNAARQRHIDQSISFNFYVPNHIKAQVMLDLHLQAWDSGLKTTYYVRSTASDIEECVWCES
ncbi:ribonucleoside-diphosphate reductase subunit alpha [Lederbergia wuyishanensis]|uniref:Ribonucleoside-diphosphate reductase n=1 Tax=Lederbergia wuyishanensis TaxID=1347903 RepID=A0ABU0D0P5_9BACI|nr:ribonucleoside-diphosphate reductase subunit alpha [Lederbergia wuyishanensis]MCJ8006582.1 ribonucleoside-diphosphate reductase subunit alpha [Lederbergia wuyishanensis]MDQ0341963.1 ribonucleoside-diphosphate reductase alpha chain [Lederbergia wuyishanensis]